MTKEEIYKEKVKTLDECIKNDEKLLKDADVAGDLNCRMQLTSEIGSLKMMRINTMEAELYRLEEEARKKKQQEEYDKSMALQQEKMEAFKKVADNMSAAEANEQIDTAEQVDTAEEGTQE